jgi:multimeric flavodoxin WrbA
MVKILCIVGSPRADSFSTMGLNAFVDAAGKENCEVVHLKELNIEHCDGTQVCQDKDCYKKDDMADLLEKCSDADAIVISSPTYYSNVSGMLKDFIDRSLPAYFKGYFKGKPGFSIVAEMYDGAINAGQAIGEFYRHSGMFCAGEVHLRDKFDDDDKAAVETGAKNLLALLKAKG